MILPTMAEEIELKLSIAPSDIEAFRNRKALSGIRPARARLDAIYLDTSGHALRENEMALRLRRTGSRWVQTLKAGRGPSRALSARPEWESAARVVDGQPRIDFRAFADSPLAELLAGAPRRPRLAPVFRTRFVRTTWILRRGKATIEVALDVGHIVVMRGRQSIRSPICEVELELKAGPRVRLLDLALELTGKGEEALALVPLPLSKAARGYLLAAGHAPAPVKAAASGFAGALSGRMSRTEALRAIADHALGLLLINAEALRVGHDPESIHQARVALRRFRSAVRLLDRAGDDFPRTLAIDVQWLAQVLGAARDWDVFSDETWPAFVEATSRGGGVDGEGTAIQQRARERRNVERAAVLSQLSSTRYASTVLRLQRWILSAPARAESMRALAPRALDRALDRLLDEARFFAALSAERRHRVRIVAKRLRYSIDLLSVVLPAGELERFSAQLSELQDVLGAINDAVVAAPLVAELGASDALEARARAWFNERAEQRVRAAEEKLLELSALPRPWRAQPRTDRTARLGRSALVEEPHALSDGRKLPLAAACTAAEAIRRSSPASGLRGSRHSSLQSETTPFSRYAVVSPEHRIAAIDHACACVDGRSSD